MEKKWESNVAIWVYQFYLFWILNCQYCADLFEPCLVPTSLARDTEPCARSISWSQQGFAPNSGYIHIFGIQLYMIFSSCNSYAQAHLLVVLWCTALTCIYMDDTSRCLLAVCTVDGHVKLYRSPIWEFCDEWVEVSIRCAMWTIMSVLFMRNIGS